MRKPKSLDEKNAILERKIGKGVKQLQSQGRTIPMPVVRDGRNNAEVRKMKPQLTVGQMFANLLNRNSQAGVKNPSAMHNRLPNGRYSKKFKGYDRENRRYNSFNFKKR